MGEEVRDPARTILRAILAALAVVLAVVLAVYALVALAALQVLGPAAPARSGAPLVDVVVLTAGGLYRILARAARTKK